MSVSESQADDVRIDVAALLGALKARWLRILVVTLVLLGATFTVLLFVPKLYESSASILVEQRNNAFTRIGNEQQSLGSITVAELAASQVQLIKSRDLLLSVVDELNLRDVREFSGASVSPVALILQLFGVKPEVKSGDEKVLENLGERLSVGQAGTSSVVTVSVQSTDPELAAAIANAIANAHVKRRADLSLSDTAEASGWLETEIAKLRTKVQQAENAVANYKADNDLFQTGGTGSSSILDQQLSTIATQITSAQERKNSAQSRADIILGLLKAGQPIDGVADVRNSMIIQNLVQSQATLRGELAQRSSTLLPNHPTIKALRAQIEAIDSQIGAEGRKVAGALRAEAEVEANLEQSLNDDLARLKLSVSAAARDTVTLDSLEREAKVQRDLLESYLARYSDAASRTDSSSTLPDVRVISVAAPSDTPASPKVGLVLSAVGFVAVALQVGTILFGELMTGRAVKERQFDVYAPEGEEAEYEEAAPQPPCSRPAVACLTAGNPTLPPSRPPRRFRRLTAPRSPPLTWRSPTLLRRPTPPPTRPARTPSPLPLIRSRPRSRWPLPQWRLSLCPSLPSSRKPRRSSRPVPPPSNSQILPPTLPSGASASCCSPHSLNMATCRASPTGWSKPRCRAASAWPPSMPAVAAAPPNPVSPTSPPTPSASAMSCTRPARALPPSPGASGRSSSVGR